MPLTTRVPQNGGAGTGLSVATSERAGIVLGAVSLGRGRRRTRRSPRAGSLGEAAAPGTPRLTAMTASISRSPSKASRA